MYPITSGIRYERRIRSYILLKNSETFYISLNQQL